MTLRGHWIGVLVLLGAGLFGAAVAVAEPLLGFPNSVSALGAPWLVCAFASGTLTPRAWLATLAGAVLLSGATAVYYGAQVYGYGPGSIGYAASMAFGWGISAALAGAVMGGVGSLWRGARGVGAALLAAVPAAALVGEAVLLSATWRGAGAALALGLELAAGAGLIVVLSRPRTAVWRTAAGTAALSIAFALAEAQLRGYMHAAGWHGA